MYDKNLTMDTDVKIIEHAPNRRMHRVSIRDTFGLDVDPQQTIEAFVEAGPMTPAMNPHHHFPSLETRMLLLAMRNKDTTYLVGPSGSGKTELVNQVAARLGYNVVQVNFDEATRVAELIGTMGVKDGATFFQKGMIPHAYLLPGTILLLDEVDMCPPGVASAMQNALSAARKFLIRQTGELVSLHPQNMVMATANTKGMGDDSGLFMAATYVQNFSFINRFETTIILDYLPPALEAQMLHQRFEAIDTAKVITLEVCQQAVRVATRVRDSFKAGSISMPLTTRDLINWLRKLMILPLPMLTAEYSFLNRMPEKDAFATAVIVAAEFKLSPSDSKTYIRNKK